MKSNAPGQLLGYAIQFRRALYHLLNSGPGDIVCIEYIGDVGVLKANSEIIYEEDKSSVVANPINDRSIELWKTFFNWVSAINENEIDVSKARFILFCNKSGRNDIINEFSNAKNTSESKIALEKAKKTLNNISENHKIWEYYDYVVNRFDTILISVIERFELEIISNESISFELKNLLRKKMIAEFYYDFIIKQIGGWILDTSLEMLGKKQNIIIRWEDFEKRFMVLFEKIRLRELIDFLPNHEIKKEKLQTQIEDRHIYIQQLEVIEKNYDELLEAATQFIKAETNRINWIENELIDEEIAQDFELKLINFWKNKREQFMITNSNLNDIEFGKLLFNECRIRIERIRNSDPPQSTIIGTYHALANEPVIGWHPKWNELFEAKKYWE